MADKRPQDGQAWLAETWELSTALGTFDQPSPSGADTGTLDKAVSLAGLTLAHAGSTLVAGGTLTLGGDADMGADYAMTGGTLALGAYTLTLEGDLAATGGTVTGTGTILHDPGGGVGYATAWTATPTNMPHYQIASGSNIAITLAYCSRLTISAGATASGVGDINVIPTANDFLGIGGTVSCRLILMLPNTVSNSLAVDASGASYVIVSPSTTKTYTQSGVFKASAFRVSSDGPASTGKVLFSGAGHSLGAVVLGASGAFAAYKGTLDLGSSSVTMAGLARFAGSSATHNLMLGSSYIYSTGNIDLANITPTANANAAVIEFAPTKTLSNAGDPGTEVYVYGDANVDGGGNHANWIINGPRSARMTMGMGM